MIDITVLDLLYLDELEEWFSDFCEFGAPRRVRTMKIGRRVRELHKLT